MQGGSLLARPINVSLLRPRDVPQSPMFRSRNFAPKTPRRASRSGRFSLATHLPRVAPVSPDAHARFVEGDFAGADRFCSPWYNYQRLLLADFVEKVWEIASPASVEAFFRHLGCALVGVVAAKPPWCAAYAAISNCGGLNRARRRRFCAVAASRNSSFAPHGPRSRKRPSRNMRLRWANNISTFFRR